MKVCPKCGKSYERLLAVSRVDGETMICDACGIDEAIDDFRREMEDRARMYVIVCNEHSGRWPGSLLFWGHRTQDHEKRSFGGYTSDIDGCEIYSERDLREKGYHFPRYHEGMTWEEFRGYDDIVIEPGCLDRLGYKQMKVWYMP